MLFWMCSFWGTDLKCTAEALKQSTNFHTQTVFYGWQHWCMPNMMIYDPFYYHYNAIPYISSFDIPTLFVRYTQTMFMWINTFKRNQAYTQMINFSSALIPYDISTHNATVYTLYVHTLKMKNRRWMHQAISLPFSLDLLLRLSFYRPPNIICSNNSRKSLRIFRSDSLLVIHLQASKIKKSSIEATITKLYIENQWICVIIRII